MRSRVIAVAILIGLAGCVPAAVFAQAGRGEINGTALDEGKGVLAGVTITAISEEQGTTRSVVTNSEGTYVIATLLPGVYTLRAELPGFQTQERRGLRLSVGQELTIEFTMPIGSVSEEVTVTGAAPLVEVTTSRIGTNVSTQEIDSLPSQGRNQLALLQTVPGLVPNLNQSTFEGGQYSANGRESTANLFMIDGVYNNDDRLGGNGGQTRVTLDSMAEF
jgi:hypothetical protein